MSNSFLTDLREQFDATCFALHHALDSESSEKSELLGQLVELNRLSPTPLDQGDDAFHKRLRAYLVDQDTMVRTQALRVARYFMHGEDAVKKMMLINYDVFVCRSLERDQKHLWERMQALKFVRRVLEISPSLLTRSIVVSLLVIAETPEDDFRRVCLDTIREIIVVNTELVATCNGVKTIVEAILDSELQDTSTELILTLLVLLDQPNKRQYIRPYLDVQSLLTIFTDTEFDDISKESRKKASSKALTTMMRSWTGILYLASDPHGLRSLVEFLALPKSVKGSNWARTAIFGFLFRLFEVITNPDSKFAMVDKITVPNLLYNYVVMLLLALIDCGLVEILTRLAIGPEVDISEQAKQLLNEIFLLSAALLPNSLCAQIHTLKEAILTACSFKPEDQISRVRSSNFINQLCSVMELTKSVNLLPNPPGYHTMPEFRSNKSFSANVLSSRGAQAGVRGLPVELLAFQSDPFLVARSTGARREDLSSLINQQFVTENRHKDWFLQNLKSHVITVVDDSTVQNMLANSQVLAFKDPTHWNMNACLELIDGPLQDPVHLSNVLQKTKFVKRLLSFLQPHKIVFGELSWSSSNFGYVRVEIKLFKLLLQSNEGSSYGFFRDAVEWLLKNFIAQFDNVIMNRRDIDSHADNNRYISLSRYSMQTTCCREMFELLGVLSLFEKGLKMLKAFDFWKSLFRLADYESCDYLSRAVVACLDYGSFPQESQSRQLLAYYITIGSSSLQRFIVSHMRLLLRKHSDSSYRSWAFELLVSQLQGEYDLALSIVDVLNEACCDPDSISILIALMPSFQVVGPAADALLLKMLAFPSGLNYLTQINWLSTHMSLWKSSGNEVYVNALENSLVSALDHEKTENEEFKFNGRTSVSARIPAIVSPPPGIKISNSASEKEKEYYFDISRIHRLPWSVSVELEYPTGRIVSLRTDCHVVTTPSSALLARCTRKEAPLEAGNASLDLTADPQVTSIVVSILDWKNCSKAVLIEPGVTIRATLSVGTEENDNVRPVILPTSVRKHIMEAAAGSTTSDVSRLPFTSLVVSNDGSICCVQEKIESEFGDDDDDEELQVKSASSLAKLDTSRNALWVFERGTSKEIQGSFSIEDDEKATSILNSAPAPNSFSLSNMISQRLSFLSTGSNNSQPNSGRQNFDANSARYLFDSSNAKVKSDGKISNIPTSSTETNVYLKSLSIPIPILQSSFPRVPILPHFYGELAKTTIGCNIIKTNGDLDDFVSIVGSWKNDPLCQFKSTPSIASVKSSLWAIGHIGSSDSGFSLLPSHAVSSIVELSNSCPTLSIRGTCFYVLGLISKCYEGRKLLSSLSWESPMFSQLGIAVPLKVASFLRIPSTIIDNFPGSWASNPSNIYGTYVSSSNPNSPSLIPIKQLRKVCAKMDEINSMTNLPVVSLDKAQLEEKYIRGMILSHISNLSNHVTQKEAHAALVSIRLKHKDVFTSTSLYAEVFRLLVSNSFNLSARRFVMFDLFEKVDFYSDALATYDQRIILV